MFLRNEMISRAQPTAMKASTKKRIFEVMVMVKMRGVTMGEGQKTMNRGSRTCALGAGLGRAPGCGRKPRMSDAATVHVPPQYYIVDAQFSHVLPGQETWLVGYDPGILRWQCIEGLMYEVDQHHRALDKPHTTWRA